MKSINRKAHKDLKPKFAPSPILPITLFPNFYHFTFVFCLLSFVLEFQFPPAFPVFSFYKPVGLFKICDPHVFSIPFVINVPSRKCKSFHLAIDRVFPAYFLTNIKTPQ
jgi:hypothetical protein